MSAGTANELAKYDFRFPKALIGTEPTSPRDTARLMVYDRTSGAVVEDVFANLAAHLPKRAVLVFNETKVVPARLTVKKQTGGKVKMLILGREVATKGDPATDAKLRPSARGRVSFGRLVALADKPIQEGMLLTVDARHAFIVGPKDGSRYLLAPTFPVKRLGALLERLGETPIPPYIKGSPLSERELRARYQTVFAKRDGSVAAPTASLHFTTRLIASLRRRGHDVRFVTLHVGLGTFAPVTEKHLAEGALHAERYAIDRRTAAALMKAKREGRPIVAVGTTALRALESAAAANGDLEKLAGDTTLFIREGYRFRFVDALVTNFHTPKSSLMMLVSAFAGRENILRLYRRAIRKKFRLFSFGDGMLLK